MSTNIPTYRQEIKYIPVCQATIKYTFIITFGLRYKSEYTHFWEPGNIMNDISIEADFKTEMNHGSYILGTIDTLVQTRVY